MIYDLVLQNNSHCGDYYRYTHPCHRLEYRIIGRGLPSIPILPYDGHEGYGYDGYRFGTGTDPWWPLQPWSGFLYSTAKIFDELGSRFFSRMSFTYEGPVPFLFGVLEKPLYEHIQDLTLVVGGRFEKTQFWLKEFNRERGQQPDVDLEEYIECDLLKSMLRKAMKDFAREVVCITQVLPLKTLHLDFAWINQDGDGDGSGMGLECPLLRGIKSLVAATDMEIWIRDCSFMEEVQPSDLEEDPYPENKTLLVTVLEMLWVWKRLERSRRARARNR